MGLKIGVSLGEDEAEEKEEADDVDSRLFMVVGEDGEDAGWSFSADISEEMDLWRFDRSEGFCTLFKEELERR